MNPALIAAATIGVGALAAVARYLVSRAFAPPSGLSSGEATYRNLPWAVLIVNVVGSAIGGAVLGLAAVSDVDPGIRLIVLTGLCGGLTTFSTFSVETVQYVMEGKWRVAAASVAANLVLGVGAAAAAYLLVTA